MSQSFKEAALPKLTLLADYRPPPFLVERVDLAFDLDPQLTTVTSTLVVRRNAANPQPDLQLDGEDIALLEARIDGKPVSTQIVGQVLTLRQVPDRFELHLVTRCKPAANTQLSGLYVSQDTFFTQCEAQGFRRITFFPDRPDVMSVYRVVLRADAKRYPVLLSNGNLVASRRLDDGRLEVEWHDPFPKPSYLFALVGGKLVAREQRLRGRDGREHLLQVYVRAGDLDKTEHALQSLVHSIAWDERRFGLPLDLDRFMIVATADFNMGAMENKGLNIFNTKYVLASPSTATDVDFANIESVVGHEYFHNWTGNRVTCRDWFQLSLKEGLTVFRDQEFSADMAGSESARAVIRIDNVRLLRSVQFPEDSGPMAHPVRPDRYAAIDNFYTATVYEKGAEVVRMIQTLAGRDGFRRGMDLYFQRHDGQAVTCDDFAQAMADANPQTFGIHLEPFKRWYAQAGTPQLKAESHYNESARRYTLVLRQTCAPSPGQPEKQPFVIPVRMGLLGRDGRALPLRLAEEDQAVGTERVLVLTEAAQTFTFVDVDEEPTPSLLRQFSAPVVLDAGLGEEQLLRLLAHDGDPFNRWEAAQTLAMQRMLTSLRGGQPIERLDAALRDALAAVLADPGLDPAFKDVLATLPSESFIAEQLDEVDPQAVHAVRLAFQRALARDLHEHWLRLWLELEVREGYRPSAEQAGRRALRNLALAMLCDAEDAAVRQRFQGMAYGRVKSAGNMTERFGALSALVACGAELKERALDHFYRLFEREELVVDKWFALQACAPAGRGDVLAQVTALLAHPRFTLGNPNRARSLVHMFCMNNPAGFHRADGAGYALWTQQLLAIDRFNPQLASRLARALERWRKLAPAYREPARAAIAQVAAQTTLSADVREVVERALADV
jgi:aminopeptidase N